MRVPFGVVGMIYEARPNVTVDAAGHLPQVRQRRAAARVSSGARVEQRGDRRRAARRAGRRRARRPTPSSSCPGDAHERVKALMRARGLVDVLIPRGGAGLIRTVVEESTVPVIETGVGNCHVYVDARRRPRQGARDRGQRQDPAPQRLQRRRDAARARRRGRRVPAAGAGRRSHDAGVTVHGDERVRGVRPACVAGHRRGLRRRVPLARHLGRAVVPTSTTASTHIRRWSSRPHRGDRHRGPARRPGGSPPRSTPRP